MQFNIFFDRSVIIYFKLLLFFVRSPFYLIIIKYEISHKNILLIIGLLLIIFIYNFNSQEPKALLHHYKSSFGGFVEKLTKTEADIMEGV